MGVPSARPWPQQLRPDTFASYKPPSHGQHAPLRQLPAVQQSQAFDRRHDRYAAPHSDLHGAYSSHVGQGQGISRQAPAPAQQPPASGLPMLSDSSDDEDDLPLPGSGSMRAMSVLQKYLPGGTAAVEAPLPVVRPPAAPLPAPTSLPVTKTASFAAAVSTVPQPLLRGRPAQGRAPPQQAPVPARGVTAGSSSDSEHSQENGNLGNGVGKIMAAKRGPAATDDMDMSPIVEHDKTDSMDAAALAKLPAQVGVFFCYCA